jgi:Protein of unknown function (DUF1236)
MRKQRTTLLAGIAALALIAGAGVASAQQTGNEGHGAKQPTAAAHEMNKTGGTMGQNTATAHGTATKMDQKAAEENKASSKMDRNAAEQEHGKTEQNAAGENRTREKMGQNEQDRNKGLTGRERENRGMTAQEPERHNGTAQRNERNRQNTAERERNGLKGLQGNARVNVQINDQQRTRIRDTVIDARGAPRIGHVDFNVAVGTVIPRTGVRIVPVTPTLVEIDPSWRGLRYFVYEQELVLVDPTTMTIVAVVNV